MIDYQKRTLDNGLTVLAEQDISTSIASVNVLYKVGSKNESPKKTGFAHLFEHLMFGGSDHAPDFDAPLQLAGGENNAFTNSDYTNFYDVLPAQNIETALWLEADRMAHLTLDQRALDVQKKVVVEEFQEVCLNKPYGDSWHHLSALAYRKHSYRWPTIGKRMSHIQKAELTDVADFYQRHYRPANAVLSICSPLATKEIFKLADKWFGRIAPADVDESLPPAEPSQRKIRKKIVYGDVPSPMFFMAFHMPGRSHEHYYACDLISDILANGRSSRLYKKLIKEQQIVSHIDCYLTGSVDNGLIIVEGRPMPDVSVDDCISAVWQLIDELKESQVSDRELQKVTNKVISSIAMSDIGGLNKAMSMAYFECVGILDVMNKQEELYEAVTPKDIKMTACRYLKETNLNVLQYLPSTMQ